MTFEALDAVLEPKTEKEVYKFIAGIAEIEPEELENLELKEFIKILKEIAEENDLKRFFTLLQDTIISVL